MNLQANTTFERVGRRRSGLVLLGLGLSLAVLILVSRLDGAQATAQQRRDVSKIVSQVEDLEEDVKWAQSDEKDDDESNRERTRSRGEDLPGDDKEEDESGGGDSRSSELSDGEKSSEAKQGSNDEQGDSRHFDLSWLSGLFGGGGDSDSDDDDDYDDDNDDEDKDGHKSRKPTRPPKTTRRPSAPGGSPTTTGKPSETKFTQPDPINAQYTQTLLAWLNDIKKKRQALIDAKIPLDSIGAEDLKILNMLINEKTGEIKLPRFDSAGKLFAMVDNVTRIRRKFDKLKPPAGDAKIDAKEVNKQLKTHLDELIKLNVTLAELRNKKELSGAESKALDMLIDIKTMKPKNVGSMEKQKLDELLNIVLGIKMKVKVASKTTPRPQSPDAKSTTAPSSMSTTKKSSKTTTKGMKPSTTASTMTSKKPAGGMSTTTSKRPLSTSTTSKKHITPSSGAATTTSKKPSNMASTTSSKKPLSSSTTSRKPRTSTSGPVKTTSKKPADGTATSTSKKPSMMTSTSTSKKPLSTSTTSKKPPGGISTTASAKPPMTSSTSKKPPREVSTTTSKKPPSSSTTKKPSGGTSTTTSKKLLGTSTSSRKPRTSTSGPVKATSKKPADGAATSTSKKPSMMTSTSTSKRPLSTSTSSKKPLSSSTTSKRPRTSTSGGSSHTRFEFNSTSSLLVETMVSEMISLDKSKIHYFETLSEEQKEVLKKVVDLKSKRPKHMDFKSEQELEESVHTLKMVEEQFRHLQHEQKDSSSSVDKLNQTVMQDVTYIYQMKKLFESKHVEFKQELSESQRTALEQVMSTDSGNNSITMSKFKSIDEMKNFAETIISIKTKFDELKTKLPSESSSSSASSTVSTQAKFRLNQTVIQNITRILSFKIVLDENGTISNVKLSKAESDLFHKVIDLKKGKITIPEFNTVKEMDEFVQTFQQIGRKFQLMEQKYKAQGVEMEDLGSMSASQHRVLTSTSAASRSDFDAGDHDDEEQNDSLEEDEDRDHEQENEDGENEDEDQDES